MTMSARSPSVAAWAMTPAGTSSWGPYVDFEALVPATGVAEGGGQHVEHLGGVLHEAGGQHLVLDRCLGTAGRDEGERGTRCSAASANSIIATAETRPSSAT